MKGKKKKDRLGDHAHRPETEHGFCLTTLAQTQTLGRMQTSAGIRITNQERSGGIELTRLSRDSYHFTIIIIIATRINDH